MASNEQILIVDDSQDLREMLAAGLRLEGYSPILASDGPEALATYDRLHCPIILLDVVLPSAVTDDLNGYAVSAKIKEIDPDAIVIIMTGLAGNMAQVRLLDSKADRVLIKPVMPEQVASEIKYIQAKREALKPHVMKAPSTPKLLAIGFALLFGFLVTGLSGIGAVGYHFYAVETARHNQEMIDLRRDEDRRFEDFMRTMERNQDKALAQMQQDMRQFQSSLAQLNLLMSDTRDALSTHGLLNKVPQKGKSK